MRLSDLKVHLNTLTQPFEAMYKERTDFKVFKNRLSELGLNKETAYLFIRGHDLFDKFTIPIIKEIGEKITNKRFQSLKNAGDTEGLKKYDDYLKQHSYVNYLKYQNTAYQSHFLFTTIMDKIKMDFENNN